MKLSTRQDIEAPIGAVFAAATNFAAVERRLEGRGVWVERDPTAPQRGPGMVWNARGSWRGRSHEIRTELVSLEEDRGMVLRSVSGGVECTTVVDLVALSRVRTRMLISLDLRPTTLASRLLVQSLKLAKRRLTERLKTRLAEFAERVEAGTI